MRRSAVRKGMVIVHKTETPPRGEYHNYLLDFCNVVDVPFRSCIAVRRPGSDTLVRLVVDDWIHSDSKEVM